MTENVILKSALKKVEAQKENFGFMERFNVDENWEVMKALEEIQEYRAIGTVEGYERAIQSSVENYNLYREYKAKVQEFEAIGSIGEFKELKEKNTPMELAEHNFQDEVHHYLCPSCRSIVSCNQNYCEECGQALET